MVDTCAAEFQAQTPYFYATYDEHCDARNFPRTGRDTVIVLGSGPIRIGQGIEFDYSSVHCVQTLKELGYDVVIINNNPETVSTDYDTADRLYFEPLTPEDVMGVIEVEHPVGVVVAFGGQTAIALTEFLDQQGIPILGTSADGIDMAEDRERFDALLEDLGIRRPKGMSVTTLEEALNAVGSLGLSRFCSAPPTSSAARTWSSPMGGRTWRNTWASSSPAASKTTFWWTSTCLAPSWRWM